MLKLFFFPFLFNKTILDIRLELYSVQKQVKNTFFSTSEIILKTISNFVSNKKLFKNY